VAKVAGTRVYTVTLRKGGATLKAWCTCPYCTDQLEPCKHIWATLRVAERRFLLGTRPRPELLALDPDVAAGASGRSPSLGGRAAPRTAPTVPDVDGFGDQGELQGDIELEDEHGEDDEFTEAGPDFSDEDDDDAAGAVARLLRSMQAANVAPRRNPALARATAGPVSISWKDVFSASRLEREMLGERPAQTELRYLVAPSELRLARSAVYFVELVQEEAADGQLAFVTARDTTRRLGRDAHAVEHWLAGQRNEYGPPRAAAEPAYEILPEVVRGLAETGRLHVGERRRTGVRPMFDARAEPLRWDGGEPWKLELELLPHAGTSKRRAEYRVHGVLVRGAERRSIVDALALTAGGLVIFEDMATRFDAGGMFGMVATLRSAGLPIVVGEAELEDFVREYFLAPAPPPLRLPGGRCLDEVTAPLCPVLDLAKPDAGSSRLQANVWFEYEGRRASSAAPGDRIVDYATRRSLLRDLEAERRHLRALFELGFRGEALRKEGRATEAPITVETKKLPAAAAALLGAGWRIEASGKPYRTAGNFKVKVQSGIDWFELDASFSFGAEVARLPALLRALKKGERTVVLDDGSVGLLPEEWLSRWGVLAEMGGAAGDKIRFLRSELPLLAAIVEGAPEVDYDAAFRRLSGELEAGGAVHAAEPPASFAGELRGYQRDGIGWLAWLERAGLGGCLADDMGLGKTVQVLAHLAQKRKGKRPSLVVAPRSVLFNWAKEAAHFAPELRVHTHWGAQRAPAVHGFDGHDLVLTTYGTLCRDVESMAKLDFRFVILDEAQAVKNAESRTAKCVRLLRAEHRLALTGTPIENHLGELFSLFEFLNPGMLGRAKRLQRAVAKSRLLDVSSARLLARAVGPFVLRRTKAEVARDLPERTEQTLYVELSDEEQKSYAELLAYYRAALAKQVADVGPERSAPHVLAALLRLRQAACHPGLLDAQRKGDGSAKLEVLLAQLEQVLAGGHKALVFSQFTSLLAIVRSMLDARGITHAYLDGKTRDRAETVERFQTDPECRVFVVSLKAGGVGLNLTAADYVFILDPWWNPAVEAQAIDRAHRIGQTKRVVAYRLLARGTVEEKVEELQQKKRALVREVFGDDAGFGGKLSREDLDLLMS
jgi:superfamily II DNA or RNA helicase